MNPTKRVVTQPVKLGTGVVLQEGTFFYPLPPTDPYLQQQQSLFEPSEQKDICSVLDTFLVDSPFLMPEDGGIFAPDDVNNINQFLDTFSFDYGAVEGATSGESVSPIESISTSSNTANTTNLITSVPISGSLPSVDPIAAKLGVEELNVKYRQAPTPVIAPRKKRHQSKELLTEEEKRANHIASEQKRRQNIRMGFRSLSMLVPDLQEQSETESDKKKTISVPSKSLILERAVVYLRYLIERNERLRKQCETNAV